MGKRVKGPIILEQLDKLAEVVGQDADHLWNAIIQPVVSELS